MYKIDYKIQIIPTPYRNYFIDGDNNIVIFDNYYENNNKQLVFDVFMIGQLFCLSYNINNYKNFENSLKEKFKGYEFNNCKKVNTSWRIDKFETFIKENQNNNTNLVIFGETNLHNLIIELKDFLLENKLIKGEKENDK
jgi:hypothetical protein